MKDDLELLNEQLMINNERIKKLERHKKEVELELKIPKSEKDGERIRETMKRLEYNLQFEYKQHDEIINVLNSKRKF